jgi:hypothetical protein
MSVVITKMRRKSDKERCSYRVCSLNNGSAGITDEKGPMHSKCKERYLCCTRIL